MIGREVPELDLLHELRSRVIATDWPSDVLDEAHALGMAIERAIARRERAIRRRARRCFEGRRRSA